MAYQMVVTAVTLNDLEGDSPLAGVFECNLSKSKICAAFYTISIDNVLARFLCSISYLELLVYVTIKCWAKNYGQYKNPVKRSLQEATDKIVSRQPLA